MRIIGGQFGGRRLVSFSADHIRPTTDRVKESLFNKLSAYWEGARVLDLFSGTGNLTIEAVSWGARSVNSVELHPKSLAIMKQNLDQFKLKDEVEVIKDDVLKYLKAYEGDTFDIILIDPPFTEKMAHAVMEQLSTSKAWGSNTIIAIEYSKFERMEKQYGELKSFDSKNFGDKLMAFFTKGTNLEDQKETTADSTQSSSED